MNSFDVIVLGGGIVGCACAREAAAAGLRVAVVEAQVIGGGATAAGMGHIVVLDDSPAQLALTRYSQELWLAERPKLPPAVEYNPAGTLWIATDDEEMAEVERKFAFYQNQHIPVQILDSQAVAQAEPNLRPGLAGALLVEQDSVIYPPAAAAYFVENRPGITLLIGQKAVQLTTSGVVLADGTQLFTPCVVNALGSWSAEFTPGLEIQKRKGHLLITDRYPGFLRHQLVELGYLKSAHSLTADSVAFNLQPRPTGQILLGSSRQFGAQTPEVEPIMVQQMIQCALAYVPTLAQLSAVRVWTGFRATTPDKLPLIGRHPEHPNLYLATGHEGLGITTALATAKLLVDELLQRPSAIPAAPYRPGRVFSHA